MKVRCINNDTNKTKLEVGKIYTITAKRAWVDSCSIRGVAGVLMCSRFERCDGGPMLGYSDSYLNPRYHAPAPHELAYGDFYVKMTKKSKLTSIDRNKFYKIKSIYMKTYYSGNVILYNDIAYSPKNFLFFTEEEMIHYSRKDKLDKLKQNI